MEAHLGSPFVIAAALIVYGVAFIVIESRRDSRAQQLVARGSSARHMAVPVTDNPSELADVDARVTDVRHMPWLTAIGIGIFQILSIVPGTSRSGSTIIGGLLLGCSRTVAAEFTFFLAVPVMVGASALRLVKFFLKGNSFALHELTLLLVGCVVAFVVSLLAIRFLMSFVKKHNFKPFGWYRIVLGAAVVTYFLLVH